MTTTCGASPVLALASFALTVAMPALAAPFEHDTARATMRAARHYSCSALSRSCAQIGADRSGHPAALQGHCDFAGQLRLTDVELWLIGDWTAAGAPQEALRFVRRG